VLMARWTKPLRCSFPTRFFSIQNIYHTQSIIMIHLKGIASLYLFKNQTFLLTSQPSPYR
jgi:hypothetical protein